MQEIHSISGGRFFGGGGGGGGDRRLRHHHHQNHQALKCPRCDSLNTKFCYYNNYNLSQPRHFCKSCRRYWTKGGVLRNVPVGGGCRKSKRSSKPKTSSSETSGTLAPQVPPSQPAEQERKSNSHSSSESSSLTAATAATTTEAVSAPSSNNLLDVQESKLFMNQSGNPSFETAGVLEQGGDCGGIFSEIGTFSSLINSPNEALPAFGFGNIPDASPFRFTALQGNDQWLQQQKVISNRGDHQELKLPEITGGSLLDQTVPVDFSSLQNKTGSTITEGFGPLDWQGYADQGLFDLPNTVDHAYWSQTHWTDQDNNHTLYLP